MIYLNLEQTLKRKSFKILIEPLRKNCTTDKMDLLIWSLLVGKKVLCPKQEILLSLSSLLKINE
jgi:hypothetical protein